MVARACISTGQQVGSSLSGVMVSRLHSCRLPWLGSWICRWWLWLCIVEFCDGCWCPGSVCMQARPGLLQRPMGTHPPQAGWGSPSCCYPMDHLESSRVLERLASRAGFSVAALHLMVAGHFGLVGSRIRIQDSGAHAAHPSPWPSKLPGLPIAIFLQPPPRALWVQSHDV